MKQTERDTKANNIEREKKRPNGKERIAVMTDFCSLSKQEKNCEVCKKKREITTKNIEKIYIVIFITEVHKNNSIMKSYTEFLNIIYVCTFFTS